MLKFDEAKFLKKGTDALAIRSEVEKIVDGICAKGYKNIFFVGIGGTISYDWQIESIMKSMSTLNYYVENAAEFTTLGNKHFSKDSLVIVDSASGDTKEVVAAVKFAQEKGAKVLGLIEKAGTPLAELVDYLVLSESNLKMYMVAYRLMYNNKEFPQYDKFFAELENLPKALVEVQKASDDKAAAYAAKYKDEPLQYLVGTGNLYGFAYCTAMCLMEEMLWMTTKSIHGAEFFHGTLEVIDRDSVVMLFKGEDATRPLMDRVENFTNTICKNVIVFDTKDYALKGISEEFRGLVSPMVMSAVCSRICAHLEEELKHPMAIRRYYRRLDY